jgi:hypothetical protein
MRRTVWIVSLAGALTLAAVVVFRPAASPAEDAPAVPGEKPAAPQLPVRRVTLYSSGVAYYQREGSIEGNARIDLAFPVQDVNDLLKSMVLQDLGGGSVSAASYDSHDPMDKALGSFAVNLATNPSFAELLQQARGEKVEVLLTKGTAPLAGNIIGIEPGFKELLSREGGRGQKWSSGTTHVAPMVSVSSPAQDATSAVTAYYQRVSATNPLLRSEGGLEAALTALASEPARLNLWCAEGLRSIPLTEVQRIRFVNPAMDREVRRALEVLAGAHDTQKRAVSLTFTGEGKRKVRVGYVVESPVWRTSYRLLVGKDGKLFLQGWAVVENPTNEDWKDVQLALVSGRPISFKMDLSQPLYVPRPTVQPEVQAAVAPTRHEGPAVRPVMTAGVAPVPATCAPALPQLGTPPAPQAQAPAGCAAPTPPAAAQAANGQAQINLERGVIAAATAAELGDFFQYEIKHPVSLPRQKSALLPIVSKAIEGTRVSIYNAATHPKFPLLAVRVKNTSGVHLMQGPVAVFEGSGYAGDAQLLDLRPGENRLISYAVDLGTEVHPGVQHTPGCLTSLRIQKGLLVTTSKASTTRTYSARNRSRHDRTVLIEHPVNAADNCRVIAKVKAVEETAGLMRFELRVPAGKSARLEVLEVRELTEQVALSSCNEQALQHLLKTVTTSDAVKQAVQKALDLKGKLSATQRQLGRLQGELQGIARDQERLRANLKELPPSTAAHKRYVEKFDRQETEIERLQAQARELQDVEGRQRQQYEAYWGRVEVGPTPARAIEGSPLPGRPELPPVQNPPEIRGDRPALPSLPSFAP